jgi:hypothetical protein
VLTLLGYLLLAVLLVGGLFYLGATLLPAGEQLAPAVRDEPSWAFEHGRAMRAEDVTTVRLPVALRGYRVEPATLGLPPAIEPVALRPPSAAERAAFGPPPAAGSAE